MRKSIFLLSVISISFLSGFSQPLSIDNYFNYYPLEINSLEYYLEDSCTDVYEMNFLDFPYSIGHFNDTTFVLPDGLLLTSGWYQDVPGPNDDSITSSLTSWMGDPLLETLASAPWSVYDRARLEYKFISQSNIYILEYFYGSEEYPELIDSLYHDLFGIFISGPNPSGGEYIDQNFALIPGTNTLINSYTINSYTNSNLYIDNGDGSSPNNEAIEFDGYTTKFITDIPIVPGEEYIVKIIIADGNGWDKDIDSGVFFRSKKEQFENYGFNIDIVSAYGNGYQLYEGYHANLVFSREFTDLSYDIPIELSYSGTATPGIDLNYINISQLIPAGQYSISIPLSVINDNIVEGSESLNILASSGCIEDAWDITVEILDNYLLEAGIPEDTIYTCKSPLIVNTYANSEDSMVTYLWNNGDTTSTLDYNNSNNFIETFSVTISHTDGQEIIDSVVVISSSEISSTITTLEQDCDLGSVFLTVSGGVPPYNYLWNNGFGLQNLISTEPGMYSVTIYDNNNCSDTAEIQLFSNSPLENTISVWSDCSGSTGVISANPVNGNPPYSYLWNSGETSDSIQNAIPGNYYLTITDVNGCILTDSILNFNPEPVTASVSVTNIGCNPGAAELIINSGNPPYEIDWSIGSSDSTWISITSPGVYEIEITDSLSCQYSTQFEMLLDSMALIDIADSVTIDPCDSTLGIIDIQVVSGLGPFTYLWSNGETTQSISNLIPGIYEVAVYDATGCSEIRDIIVPVNDVLSHEIVINNITDCNSDNGFAEVMPSGGLWPYSYIWSTGDTLSFIDSLESNIYTFTLSDACGDQIVDSVFPVYESYLNFDTIIRSPVCFSTMGSIEFLEQSNLPFTSILTDTLWQHLDTSLNGIFMDLSAQVYNLIIEDTFLCQDSIQIDLIPSTPGLSLVADPPVVPCNGSLATLSASFDDSYSQTYLIDSLSLQAESMLGDTLPSPEDDRIYGPFPIGFDFSFFNGSYSQFYIGTNGWISFSAPTSGTWTDIWFVEPIPNSIPFYAVNAIFAAYRDWDPSSGGSIKYHTIGTSPNRKLVVSYDSIPAFLCTSSIASFQIVLYENGDIIDVNFINIPTCTSWLNGSGVSGIQNASGTIAYFLSELNDTPWTASNYTLRYSRNMNWYNSNFDIIGSGPEITVEVDSLSTYYFSYSNCIDSISDDIIVGVENYYPEFNLGENDTLCMNDYLGVTPDSSYSFSWNTGDTLSGIYITQSSNYSLTVTNGACSTSDNVYLNIEEININFQYDTLSCNSVGTCVSLNPEYDYSWANGFNGCYYYTETAGIHDITAYSDNCVYEYTLEIELVSSPVSLLNDTLNACGDYTIIQPGDAGSYSWSNGYIGQDMLINQPGLYIVTMTSAVCETVDSVEVIFYPPAIPDLGPDTAVCYGTIININPGSFAQYLWQNGLQFPDINIVEPYTYWVSVTDINGCTGVDTLIYSVIYDPISDFSFAEAFGTVQFYNESQYATNYMWYFGDGSGIFTENPVHTYPSLPNNEFYTVTLVANNMCGTDTSELELIIFDIEGVDLHDGINIYPNPFKDELTIDGLKPNDKIRMFDILGKDLKYEVISMSPLIISILNANPGIYFLSARNENDTRVLKIIKQ